MGRIVIAAYRPKPGRQEALETLMRRHHGRLRAEGLVTDRRPTLMRAGDGTVVEVFEWLSADAIAAAHRNRAVQRMWDEYAQISDTVPLHEMSETHALFAEFEPMPVDDALYPEFSP
jgi:hypothetical protein